MSTTYINPAIEIYIKLTYNINELPIYTFIECTFMQCTYIGNFTDESCSIAEVGKVILSNTCAFDTLSILINIPMCISIIFFNYVLDSFAYKDTFFYLIKHFKEKKQFQNKKILENMLGKHQMWKTRFKLFLVSGRAGETPDVENPFFA